MVDRLDEFKQMVINYGDEIAIDEPPCVLWKAEHKNCFGCMYELGCSKMVRLALTSLQSMIYQPRDFDDLQKMSRTITQQMRAILEAKTVGQLKAIEE